MMMAATKKKTKQVMLVSLVQWIVNLMERKGQQGKKMTSATAGMMMATMVGFDEESEAIDVCELGAVAGKPNRKKRARKKKDDIGNSGDDGDKDHSTDEESKNRF